MQQPVQQPVSVVGIGASAGGIEALQHFFTHMPVTSGLAFVIVLHLSPTHESHLAELLQGYTAMPVTQVNADLPIAANQVYVIPPNHNLSTIDTHLRLSPLEERRTGRAQIDHFFRTLAAAQQEKAIGIILSGTGSDGAVGLTRIKEQGGLTIVQAPDDATYDGMPQRAIATGLVDFILPVEAMPAQLLAYLSTTPAVSTGEEEEVLPADAQLLHDLLTHLRSQLGQDFTRYKPATLLRRIRRRMQMGQMKALTTYLDFLREHREEAEALAQDFLITVTNFFRDAESFAALTQQVIPQLFQGKTGEQAVRVWVVGCATGEEAYSLGMLLLEYAGQLAQPPPIQIFATDLSEPALRVAREGLYVEAIQTDVSAERLARFFYREPSGYRVKRFLRELVTFASHNLLKDPPFLHIDLISCRNLLIYLQRDVQERIFARFHYALCPQGYLWLGPAESLTGETLFRTVSKLHNLFQWTNRAVTQEVWQAILPMSQPSRLPGTALPRAEHEEALTPGALHQELVEAHAPPSLLVNADYQVVHLSEQVGRYLQQPGGEPTQHLLKLIRSELCLDLTAALQQSFATQKPVQVKPIPLALDGRRCAVSLFVQPARPPYQPGHSLVFFLETEAPEADELTAPDPQFLPNQVVAELARTQTRLRTVIEEFEASKEEMRANSEELLSMNEELKAAAEELETSKEELQSINEELLTTNQEKQQRLKEMKKLTSDLENLLAATDIATLFLDRELRIQWFTPRISTLFNVMLGDKGRPLAHLTHKLGDVDLIAETAQVLKTLIPQEREIRSKTGEWYLMRLLPYRTIEDYIDGVVLTFVEISTLKQSQAALQESAAQFQRAIMAAPVPMLMYSEAGEILAMSERARQLTGSHRQPPPHVAAWLHLAYGAHAAEMSQLISHSFQTNQALFEREFRVETQQGEQRTWLVSMAAPEQLPDGRKYAVTTAVDITERKQAEVRLQELNATLEQQVAARTGELAATNAALRVEIAERAQAEQARQQVLNQLLNVQEEERRHFALELHDSLGQHLTALALNLKAVQARHDCSPGVVDQLEQLQTVILSLDNEVDRLAFALHPPLLEDLGLVEALREYTQSWSATSGIAVNLHTHTLDQARLPRFIETTIYRIVQEALTNILKHAQATQVRLSLERRDAEVLTRIEDNGTGFDLKTIRNKLGAEHRFGLQSMEERATLAGGQLAIDTTPGGGTILSLHLPLPRAGEEGKHG